MAKVALLLLATLAASGCASHSPSVTADELRQILDVTIWRVPVPPNGQWTIEVEDLAAPIPVSTPTVFQKISSSERGTVAFQSLGHDIYRFTLIQNHGQSSGEFKPCAEPEGSASLCDSDGWDLEFEEVPRCNSDCSGYLLGTLKPMMSEQPRKAILLKVAGILRIKPGKDTIVVPVH